MSTIYNLASKAYNNAANINNLVKPSSETEGSSATGVSGDTFSGIINSAIGSSVNTLRTAENTVAKSLVKQADITDVVTAITSAEVTLRTVMEVRDKLVAAHQEISRMPI